MIRSASTTPVPTPGVANSAVRAATLAAAQHRRSRRRRRIPYLRLRVVGRRRLHRPTRGLVHRRCRSRPLYRPLRARQCSAPGLTLLDRHLVPRVGLIAIRSAGQATPTSTPPPSTSSGSASPRPIHRPTPMRPRTGPTAFTHRRISIRDGPEPVASQCLRTIRDRLRPSQHCPPATCRSPADRRRSRASSSTTRTVATSSPSATPRHASRDGGPKSPGSGSPGICTTCTPCSSVKTRIPQ